MPTWQTSFAAEHVQKEAAVVGWSEAFPSQRNETFNDDCPTLQERSLGCTLSGGVWMRAPWTAQLRVWRLPRAASVNSSQCDFLHHTVVWREGERE